MFELVNSSGIGSVIDWSRAWVKTPAGTGATGGAA